MKRLLAGLLLLISTGVFADLATVLTIPQTTLSSPTGSVQTNNISSSVSQYVATLDQINWPFAGDLAFFYALDYSNDNGKNWQTLTIADVWDVPETIRGQSGNKFMVIASVPEVGNNGRRLRFRWFNCKPGITVSGTLQVQ